MFEYVRSRVNPIQRLAVGFHDRQAAWVRNFVERVGAPMRSLILSRDKPEPTLQFCINPDALPNLRALTIQHFAPVVPGTFRGLTQLSIVNVWEHPETTLYGLLNACPDLEELYIFDSLPLRERYTVQRPGELVPVRLPRMRRLRMCDSSGWDLGWFLQWIRIPASASFYVEASYANTPPDPDEYEGWLAGDLFPQPLHALPMVAQSQSIAVYLGSAALEEDFRLFGLNEAALTGDQHDSAWGIKVGSLDVGKTGTPASGNDDDGPRSMLPVCCPYVLRDLPKLVEASKILSMQLHVAPGLPGQCNWDAWLASFPNLGAMIVGGAPLIESILEHLRKRGDLLPRLEALQFCVAVLPEDPHNAYVDLDVFAAWLAARRLAGRQIKQFAVRVPSVATVQTTSLAAQLFARATAQGVDEPSSFVIDTCRTCHFVFDAGECAEGVRVDGLLSERRRDTVEARV